MSAKPKRTAAQRRSTRYGTKRFAMDEMLALLRTMARAKRAHHSDQTRFSKEYDYNIAFGAVLGARGALSATGVLSGAQYERVSARLKRIINAEVSRRPFANLKVAA